MWEKLVLSLLTCLILVTILFLFNNAPVPKIKPPADDGSTATVRPTEGHQEVKCKNFVPGTKLDIVGGQTVRDDAEFPFQLKLYQQGNFECGASIIADNIAITAAHCLYVDNLPDTNLEDYLVTAGIIKNRRNVAWEKQPHEQRRRLAKIQIHPDYKFGRLGNDIAMFRIERNFTFNKWVNKIRIPLPPGSSGSKPGGHIEAPKNLTGLCAMATGFGLLDDDETHLKFPGFLQKVEVPVVDCYNYFAPPADDIDDTMICAGQPQSGICRGDSGGPLFLEFPPPSGPLLVGISSWTNVCGGLKPAGFTNVRFFTEWIYDTIRNM